MSYGIAATLICPSFPTPHLYPSSSVLPHSIHIPPVLSNFVNIKLSPSSKPLSDCRPCLASFEMAQRYTYQPLGTDQIRLVQLLPSHNNQVHIKLVVCGLTEVAFDALSYSWGAPLAASNTIDCEGQHMKITRNLFLFLQSLLQCSQILPLWIDAISINQKNMSGKSHVAPQTPLIFRTARRTICWTGCELGIIGSLSPILDVGCYQRVLAECFSRADILHSMYKINENDLTIFRNAAKDIDTKIWSNLDVLLDQDYFNRYGRSLFEFLIVTDVLHPDFGKHKKLCVPMILSSSMAKTA
jgi:hypothetical protein